MSISIAVVAFAVCVHISSTDIAGEHQNVDGGPQRQHQRHQRDSYHSKRTSIKRKSSDSFGALKLYKEGFGEPTPCLPLQYCPPVFVTTGTTAGLTLDLEV